MKSISHFLVWQKRKLSDKPVEAGEDYTKFNSADFARKVSVCGALCLNRHLLEHWLLSLLFVFIKWAKWWFVFVCSFYRLLASSFVCLLHTRRPTGLTLCLVGFNWSPWYVTIFLRKIIELYRFFLCHYCYSFSLFQPSKKMSAAQKSLAKADKTGMKPMSSFFSPKVKTEKKWMLSSSCNVYTPYL